MAEDAAPCGLPAPRVLSLGSCHVHDALAGLERRGRVRRLWADPDLSHSPQETLQVLDIHASRRSVPPSVLGLGLLPDPRSNPPNDGFPHADAVFIELGSTIDIAFDGVMIKRAELMERVLQPLFELGRPEREIVNRWYRQGLLKGNEDVRRETARLTLDFVPRTGLDLSLVGALVEGARGVRQDVDAAAATLRQVCERLGTARICVLSAYNAFTPDGRPMTWPGNFIRESEEICARLGLTLLHPWRLVAEHGVAFSVQPDLHHYTPAFLEVLGEALLAAVQPVVSP